MSQIIKKNKYDIIAAAIFIVLLLFNFYSVKFGIRIMDEHLYIAIAQRFADGMKPLVDEWHVTQLSDLILVIPYVIFKKITGGTDGILLFMRRLFVVVNSLLFFVFYKKLRSYKAWGLIAAAVVSAFVPHAMFVLNYYTMTIHLLMLFAVFVLLKKGGSAAEAKIPTPNLLFGGVILSMAVITQPPLAFLYVIFSIAVIVIYLVRKRKAEFAQNFGFFLNFRCWKYISISVVICAFVFIVFLQIKSGLSEIWENIPNVLDDPYYDVSAFKSFFNSLVSRIILIIKTFGPVNCILLVTIFPTVIILHLTKLIEKFKYQVFLASNILIALWFAVPLLSNLFLVKSIIQEFFCLSPLPFLAFGFANYFICEEKNPHLLLIWFFAAFSSLFIDVFSTYTFGTYGIIAFVPGMICFGKVLEEFKTQKKSKRAKAKRRKNEKTNRIFLTASAVVFSAFILLFCYNTYLQATRLLYEGIDIAPGKQQVLTKVQSGPFRGIYTSEDIKNNIYDYQSDLELLKRKSKTHIYINNPNPMAFSYLDIPTANRFVWPSISFQSRHLRFFAEHPESRPDAIYLCYTYDLFGLNSWDLKDTIHSFYSELASKMCDDLCNGQVVNGKRGIIIFVNQWKEGDYNSLIEWAELKEKEIAEEYKFER